MTSLQRTDLGDKDFKRLATLFNEGCFIEKTPLPN